MNSTPRIAALIPAPGEAPLASSERRIFLSAATLFAEGALLDLDYAELARAARVPEETLRQRFPSADSLLISTLSYLAHGVGHGYLDASGGRGWAGLRAVPQVVRAMTEQPGLYEFYCQCLSDGATQGHPLHDWVQAQAEMFGAYLMGCVASGIELGEISPSADPEAISRTLSALQFGAGRAWTVAGSGYDVAAVIEGYVGLLHGAYAVGQGPEAA